MKEIVIGVDLGGTRIRAARMDEDLSLIDRQETLTLAHQGLDATLERIKDLIRKVMPDDNRSVTGIGVSAPGPLNPGTGVVVAPPNLPGWHNVPLGDILHETFGVPVYVGNDANVAALAEVARGAAQGYRHAIYITVSTGIGSGIVYDGRLLLGKTGLAAEAGHMILLVDGRVSSLEKEAAGPALARKAQAELLNGRQSLLLEMADGNIDAVDARLIGQAVEQNDVLAMEVLAYGTRCVGLGIVSLLHLFNPEIVVIGGGVSNIGDLFFDNIRNTVREYALDSAYWDQLSIVPAALQENVSIIGAGTLVLTEGGHSDVTRVLAALNQQDQ